MILGNAKQKERILLIVRTVFVVVSVLLILVPIFLTVMNSFKSAKEIADSVVAFPKNPNLKNFQDAWRRLHYPVVLKNTFIITAFSVIGCVIFAGMTGYWIARHDNVFTRIWNVLFLSGMSVPFQCIMITFATMIGLFNLGNTYAGIVVSFWAFTIPMAMFLTSGAVKAVPLEIEEAAIIDGCGMLGLYWRIVFPLIKGTIFTIASLNVLHYWNDYLMTQFILTKKDLRTIQIAMQSLFNEALFSWNTAVAAVTLSMLPMFLFFLIAQKQVLQGATEGAVKG